MQADYSVELGADDPCLELPWTSAEDPQVRYYDLKQRPELLLNIEEAMQVPELGEFLAALNSSRSAFQSAKCDAWQSEDISEAERVFGAPRKFCSYVDLMFSEDASRFDLDRHVRFSGELARLLGRAPEIAASAEVAVRRCYYHHGGVLENDSRAGYYVTLYVCGFGDDAQDARSRWAVGLKLAENALLQLSLRG